MSESATIAPPNPRAETTAAPARKLMWGSCSLPALVRLLARNRFAVDGSRRFLLLKALMHSALSTGAGCWQALRYGAEVRRTALRAPPLFVLGHWRSGTTFLHNLLALDPRHSYPNTYECFMPLHFLLTEDYVLRRAPRDSGHRASDNVPAGWDRPQEDEFALALLGQPSPYLTLAFPNHPPADPKFLDLEGVPPSRRAAWKRTLHRFLLNVTFKRPGRLVLKSPTHTARIKVLLEMFPDAQFVYLVRNPYEVIPSTLKTIASLGQRMGLQDPHHRGLEAFVFGNYETLFRRVHEGRHLVRPEHFHELRYEDLARDPVGQAKAVYDHLNLGAFEKARPRLEAHVASLGSYEGNVHHLTPNLRDAIARRCGGVLDQYGYREDGL